ncbi:MAG: metallophosphatase family protein [Nanoarchaeota archaeon]|nr:metallophosphatase family protein [Nanoarchaeota archaeon]MBU4352106.1 metallophosphatase family protein [Nanoarchaeota archaeon]MBU4455926.1 metallophosphatase family protein [Nanoarchaeota archaeon]MCG2719430.1 metallophosphatase family protein [Nanoarchaeota archaeon]
MKIALISDIHANLEAFEEVLKDIKKRNIKNILCAGDIVGFGANPNECCKLVKDNNIVSVKGNFDVDVITLKDAKKYDENLVTSLQWTNKQLTDKNKDFLIKLPKMNSINLKDLKILLVHASVTDPFHGRITQQTSDDVLREELRRSKSNILVIGHTHIPMVKRLNNSLIINPGSVGQPRDNRNLASYAILETEVKSVNIVRIKYDIDTASKKIITSGLPRHLADRLFSGN